MFGLFVLLRVAACNFHLGHIASKLYHLSVSTFVVVHVFNLSRSIFGISGCAAVLLSYVDSSSNDGLVQMKSEVRTVDNVVVGWGYKSLIHREMQVFAGHLPPVLLVLPAMLRVYQSESAVHIFVLCHSASAVRGRFQVPGKNWWKCGSPCQKRLWIWCPSPVSYWFPPFLPPQCRATRQIQWHKVLQ